MRVSIFIMFSFCRSHCYKIVMAVVVFFVLAQYTTNVLVRNHIPKLIAPSLSWVSSISAHKILGLDLRNDLYNQEDAIVNVSSPLNITRTQGKVQEMTLKVIPTQKTIVTTVAKLWNVTAKITELPACPMVPPKLVGRLKVLEEDITMSKLEKLFPNLEPGGRYKPTNCTARHKVAIIVPYRDREYHLKILIHNLHPILQRQQLDYGIYVVEEFGKSKFNRAKLMNVGYVEAAKDYEYDCFIFHDVDLIPEDDRNIYSCPEQPRHMSVAINSFNYRLPYKDIFGGVSALSRLHMQKVNGFSNEFWGWGGEDDDMSNRLRFSGLHITRYPASIARYKMLKHSKDVPNPDRYNKLYKGRKRFKTDGLNSLKYVRKDFVLKKLFTWVLADLKAPGRS